MPTFYDRRTDTYHDYQSGSWEHLNHLYGSGEEGFRQMFPGQQSDALVPWHQAGGIRNRGPWEPEKVRRALTEPQDLVHVDPRRLTATQPRLVRAAVEHYMTPEYRRGGDLFADRANPGNRYPVVYARTHPETGSVENLILSGHHRAAASLLGGQFLRARFVEGGFGREHR